MIHLPLPEIKAPRTQYLSITLIASALASVLMVYAYGEIQPIILASFLYAVLFLVVCVTFGSSSFELTIFSMVYSTGWVATGVAAVFLTDLQDYHQVTGDSGRFYRYAAASHVPPNLELLRTRTEGSLAVYLWRYAYLLADSLGLGGDRYVGACLNVTCMALSGVFTVQIARRVFGAEETCFHRLIAFFSVCGLFWAFAGLHLRDAFVVLVVTSLAYTWCRFIADKGSTVTFAILAIGNIFGMLTLRYLRNEFVFVPFAMSVASVLSLFLGVRSNASGRALARAIVVAACVLLLAGIAIRLDGVSHTSFVENLERGHDSYTSFSEQSSGSDSLGVRLIIGQPLPVRIVLGSAYLLFFPVPFWGGLQSGTAYHLFKSINVLLFYIVVPNAVTVCANVARFSKNRNPALLFCILCSLGFLLAIAATSLETRHLGAFYPMIFIVAAAAPLSRLQSDRLLRSLRGIMAIGVIFVHLIWLALKL